MRRIGLLLLLLVPVAAAPPAEEPAGFAALLPADTLLMAEFDDLGGCDVWRKETALGRIAAEPEVQRFLAQAHANLFTLFAQTGGGALGTVGLTPEDFRGIRLRRGGLALVDANWEGGPVVDAMLFLEAREGGEKLQRIVAGVRAAAETFLGLRFEEVEVSGHKVARTNVLNTRLFLSAEGNRVLVTTREDRMARALAALGGATPADSLATAPAYTKIRARMGATASVTFAYANVPRLYARVTGVAGRFAGPGAMGQVDFAWERLGLSGIEAFACGDLRQGAGFRSECAVTLRQRAGLFGLLPHGAPTHRFADVAPADSLLYAEKSADLAEFWGALLALVGGFDADARRHLEEGMEEASRHLQVDIRKDLFAALGTEWALYVAPPPGGGPWPDVVLLATLRDRAALESALGTAAAHLAEAAGEKGAFCRLRRTADERIRYIELAQRNGDAIPVAPAWAFGDGYVAFGLWPQAVRNALREKTPLARSEGWRTRLADMPAGAYSLAWIDAPRLCAWLYNALTPLLQVVQGAGDRKLEPRGVQLALADLPPADVITRHLSPALFYAVSGDDCVRMGFVSDFGAAFLAVPVAAAATVGALAARGRREAAVREMERAREEALRRENEMLRRRLAEIEREVAEIRRLLAEREGDDK